jgi:ABC-type branched-subunit amino acid transport system substrate-binding protein
MTVGINKRASYAGVVLLMATAAALGGCASGGASSGGSGGSGSSAAGSIKILVTGPFTGTTYSTPEIPLAAQAAASTINASGGVNGHKISIVLCNDQDNPNVSTQCAREAVSDDVVAVAGLYLFGTQLYSVLTPANIPVISSTPIAPIEATAKNSFPISGGTTAEEYAETAKIVEAGAKNVAIIHGNSQSNLLGVPALEQGIEKAGGKVVANVTAQLGAPSYAPYVAAALSSGKVQGIAYVGVPGDFGTLMLAVQQSRFKGPIASLLSGTTPQVLKSLGSTASQLYLSSLYYVPPAQQASSFVSSMDKYSSQAAQSAMQTPVAEGVWASIYAVAKGLESATGYTAADLMTSLSSQKSLQPTSFAPTVDMTTDGPIPGSPRIFTADAIVCRVKPDGTVYPDGGFFNPFAQ